VTNLSKAGQAAAHGTPAPAARRQPVASPFAKASAAAAAQRGESAKAESLAVRGDAGIAGGLQAARSGSGAGAAGSTSPPRGQPSAIPQSGAGDTPPAPHVAAGGRAVTAEVCCRVLILVDGNDMLWLSHDAKRAFAGLLNR